MSEEIDVKVAPIDGDPSGVDPFAEMQPVKVRTFVPNFENIRTLKDVVMFLAEQGIYFQIYEDTPFEDTGRNPDYWQEVVVN